MITVRLTRCARALAALLIVCLAAGLCGCGYKPIESTPQESREVGRVGDYFVRYEELRYLTMTFKEQFERSYGEGIWDDPVSAEKYRGELEDAVRSALKHDAAVQSLCAEVGFGINEPAIITATEDYVAALVKELGGMKKYKRYLEENFMTDAFMRQTVAVDYLITELVYAYIETEFISNDFNEIYDAIMDQGMFVRTLHVFVSEDTEDARGKINAAHAELEGGADFLSVMEKYSEDAELDAEEGMYFVSGEVDDRYYEVSKELGYDEYSRVFYSSGGYVIVKRLAPDPQYIMMNYKSIVDRYQYAVVEKTISDRRQELEFQAFDYFNEIDLVAMQ